LRVRPHAIVHRRDEQHGGLGGEQAGGQEIVGLPRRGARHEIRRRRRDDDGMRGAREMDVVERTPGIEQPGMHRAACERFKGDCADEFSRGRRHHHVYRRSRLTQQPRQPR